VEAIRHLGRRRRTVSGTVGIGFRAIPRDHRNAGGCLEPLRARVARAVREQGDGLAAFQIKEHGARGRAFAQGAIVHPQPAGRGGVRQRLLAPQAPECVPAHPQVPLVAKLHPGCAPVGRRSVQMRRRQGRLPHNHLRTRSGRRTRYCAQGRSARVRS
jgi:hypothetical protein